MTLKSGNKQRLQELNSPDRIFNAVAAILSRRICKVIRFIKELGRSRCPWAYCETPDGKRFATFLSPKEFTGYWWNENNTVTVNLETGARYRVNRCYCDCKDWQLRVSTGKKKSCKHQDMRVDRLRDSSDRKNTFDQLYQLNPDILESGLSLERNNDYIYKEYYLVAWLKNNPWSEPQQKRIGRIIETDRGFMAAGMNGNTRSTEKFQAHAVGWILRYNGISYAQILAAYQESQLPRIKPKANPTRHKPDIIIRSVHPTEAGGF